MGIGKLGKTTGAERQALAADLFALLERQSNIPEGLEPRRVQQAREQFAQVLAGAEFAPDREPTWLERQWKAFKHWLYEALTRSFAATSNTFLWVRILMEVLLFLIPVVLLAVWLLRQAREDRLRPISPEGSRKAGQPAPHVEWLAMAEELARHNQWREAIHALYWATVVTLESRKLLAVNRTRTPREYMRLLEPGSAVHAVFVEQARLFELTWYGQQEATETAFRRAIQLRAAAEAQ